MKIVTIEVKETNDNKPWHKVIKFRPLEAIKMDSLDKLPTTAPDSEIEIYPLIEFGYGGNFREGFYCRERDKDALLEAIVGFTDEAKKVLLKNILNHVIGNGGKDTICYLEELMSELETK